MAASKKKVVSKDDLRRLMKAKTAEVKSTSKIQHPLAKYNSIGQILCTLCNTVIKSDILWNVHLQSKSHKQLLLAPPKSGLQPDVKRKSNSTESDHTDVKKSRRQPSTVGQVDKANNHKESVFKPKSILKNSRLAQYSSSEDDSEDDDKDETSNKQGPALPIDFFESKQTKNDGPPAEKPEISEVLPEGFFDDPVLDAKARQVEYRDKMEVEWETFQRAMKEETHVSEAIQEDEDEQTTLERNIIEIDEQMQNWREIDELQDRRESLMQNRTERMVVSEGGESEGEEGDYDEFLDWRSKTAWR